MPRAQPETQSLFMTPTVPTSALDPLIRGAALELRDGLRSAFGSVLSALYLYGGVTFPDSEGTGDLDYHAILAATPTPAQHAATDTLTARLAARNARSPGDLDGWFISIDQARRSDPPAHLLIPGLRDMSWALHRAHWLAGRCVVLHGPDPATLITPPTAGELRAGLQAELEFAARDASGAYVVLNACRITHSAATGNVVVSKFGSAQWGLASLPAEYSPAITAAMNVYRSTATPGDVLAVASGRNAMLALAARALAAWPAQ